MINQLRWWRDFTIDAEPASETQWKIDDLNLAATTLATSPHDCELLTYDRP